MKCTLFTYDYIVNIKFKFYNMRKALIYECCMLLQKYFKYIHAATKFRSIIIIIINYYY